MHGFVQLLSRFRPQCVLHKISKPKSTCVRLANRTIVKVSGAETVQFLQGLVSNDVRHLTENSGTSVSLPCIYTLILNLQGRVLYDALLYGAPGERSNEIWLECDTRVSSEIVNLLKKYRVRKKIDIAVAEDIYVCASIDEDEQTKKEAVLFVKDPRINSIGFRAIYDRLNSAEICDKNEEYVKRRYKFGLGEGVLEHPPGKCFPLEINGDYLHGVSFFKGCYVGQELTSRTHHIGVVRKRYMPIKLSQQENYNVPQGTIIENEAGKNVGKFVNAVDGLGLALLRIQEATNAKELKIKGQDLIITTCIPEWWPKKETRN